MHKPPRELSASKRTCSEVCDYAKPVENRCSRISLCGLGSTSWRCLSSDVGMSRGIHHAFADFVTLFRFVPLDCYISLSASLQPLFLEAFLHSAGLIEKGAGDRPTTILKKTIGEVISAASWARKEILQAGGRSCKKKSDARNREGRCPFPVARLPFPVSRFPPVPRPTTAEKRPTRRNSRRSTRIDADHKGVSLCCRHAQGLYP